jgi:hypothetical protein
MTLRNVSLLLANFRSIMTYVLLPHGLALVLRIHDRKPGESSQNFYHWGALLGMVVLWKKRSRDPV